MISKPFLAQAVLLGLVGYGGADATAGANDLTVDIAPARAGRYEKVEFTVRRDAAYRNPFDPDEVEAALELSTPGGARLRVAMFYCQEYERRRVARGDRKADWIYPAGRPAWKARFAPTELGVHRAVAAFKDARGSVRSQPVEFEAAASQRKGFVRASKRDPRFLEFDGGQPLFLIGQNLAFIGPTQYANLGKAEEIFGKLSQNGANYLRIWTCCEDWATCLEGRKSAWARSWDWKPPVAPWPGREHDPSAPKCVRLSGERGKSLAAAPSYPLAVKPATRYVLRGRIRTEGGARLRCDADGRPLGESAAANPGAWSGFKHPFTTRPDQWWIDRIGLRLASGGTVWLDGLSLQESSGGPELLWEADVNRPSRGFYNPVDCFMVDQIVEASDKAGIYLQLCLLTRDLYMDALKDEKSPQYRQAIRDARKLLRYAVARWSYATSVAAWEYFNEMNPGLPTDLFYTELGKYLEEVDVHRHLRTTSGWGPTPKDWRLPQLDFAQLHHYLRPESKEGFRDEVAAVLERTQFLKRHAPDKPVLLGEFGLAENNWQQSPYMKQDADLVHFHNILWASALSGASGTAQFWWWDQLDRQDAYRHYRPLASFVSEIPFTAESLREFTADLADAPVRAVGLQGPRSAYVWLFHRDATWWNMVVQKAVPAGVRGARLELRGLTPGAYRVQWWDTYEGKAMRQTRLDVGETPARLDVPEFRRDIACKIRAEP